MSYPYFQTQALLLIQWILLHKLLFMRSFPWKCFKIKKQTCAGEDNPRIKQHISSSLFGNTMSAEPAFSSPGSCAKPIAAADLSEHASLWERNLPELSPMTVSLLQSPDKSKEYICCKHPMGPNLLRFPVLSLAAKETFQFTLQFFLCKGVRPSFKFSQLQITDCFHSYLQGIFPLKIRSFSSLAQHKY